MHSSGMHTACTLTVGGGCCAGGWVLSRGWVMPLTRTTSPWPCLLRSSVSVWVSVWVIWRITNRHSVKYAELRIGILLKVCRFLIRHTLPNADVISSYHAVKYAELRIGSILKVCRFVIRHITQTETQTETEANFTHTLTMWPIPWCIWCHLPP